jgi:hypothetical protein
MPEETDQYGLVTVLKGQIEAPDGAYARQRQQLRAEFLPVVVSAKQYEVTNLFTYQEAVGMGSMLQALSGKVTEFYKPVKQVFDAAKKIVLDNEKLDAGLVNAAKNHLSVQVSIFEAEQERQRQAAEKIAREAVAKAEQERRLERAIELDQEGYKEEAVRLLDSEELAPPVIVQASIPKKSPGSVHRRKWHAQVNDPTLLIKGIAAGSVPIQAVKIDQAWLDKQATQYQGGLNYPGVSTYEEQTHHFRS